MQGETQSPFQPPKKERSRRDPESEFYDTIKHKPVVVCLSSGKTLKGTLRWVATYSVGVESTPGHVLLVMKGGIESIEIGG